MDERVEIMARVNVEHRTNGAWAWGHGGSFGFDTETHGTICLCGAEFVSADRDSDTFQWWSEHWAAENLAALEANGYTVAKLEQGYYAENASDTFVITNEDGALYRIVEDE